MVWFADLLFILISIGGYFLNRSYGMTVGHVLILLSMFMVFNHVTYRISFKRWW